jgi:hypothetical protein
MRWTGHVARTEDIRNTKISSMEKSAGKRLLSRTM